MTEQSVSTLPKKSDPQVPTDSKASQPALRVRTINFDPQVSEGLQTSVSREQLATR